MAYLGIVLPAVAWFINNMSALWEEFLMYFACDIQDQNSALFISKVPANACAEGKFLHFLHIGDFAGRREIKSKMMQLRLKRHNDFEDFFHRFPAFFLSSDQKQMFYEID